MKKLLNNIFKPKKKNIITPYQNGPLHITGSLVLKDSNGNLLEEGEELFLCRCGNSNKKPYCDGQHKKTNYQDDGKLKQPPPSETGLKNKGTLEIKVNANGPLVFNGAVSIKNSAEQECVIRSIGSLCRCGHSANSPFCDGTHTKTEFNVD